MSMEEKDKKNNKTKASKIWDSISFLLMIGGFIFCIICLIAGIGSLAKHEPFVDVLFDILKTVFSVYILLPLSIIALFIIIELIKALFDSHPFICIILIVLIMIAVPVGSSTIKKTHHSSGDQFTKQDVQTQWNYFENISRLGDEYKYISHDYGPLSDESVMNGGVFLRGSNDLFYAFPKYSKSDITETDLCSGMAGTAEALLGYKHDVSVKEFKNDLGLTSETELDGNLTFKKTSSIGYYYVTILNVDITNESDSVTSDTWISITQRNREVIPIGSLEADQNAARETVFFVQTGDCYHRDSSCSTLHDSDVIYECYIDEVPEGRSPCSVCY